MIFFCLRSKSALFGFSSEYMVFRVTKFGTQGGSRVQKMEILGPFLVFLENGREREPSKGDERERISISIFLFFFLCRGV
jgi:hypothetical protein